MKVAVKYYQNYSFIEDSNLLAFHKHCPVENYYMPDDKQQKITTEITETSDLWSWIPAYILLSDKNKENKDYFSRILITIYYLCYKYCSSVLRIYKLLIDFSVLELGICLNIFPDRNLKEHWLQSFSLFSEYWGRTNKYKPGNSHPDHKPEVTSLDVFRAVHKTCNVKASWTMTT